MDYVDVLRNTEVFQSLTDDELHLVAALCDRESHPAGTQLSQQGDEVSKVYIVEEGRVHFQIQIGGGRLWSVDSSSRGECFGWAALLDPPYRWASGARCVEPTALVRVDAPGLRALCRSHLHIGFKVMSGIARLISRRLDHTRRQVASVADRM